MEKLHDFMPVKGGYLICMVLGRNDIRLMALDWELEEWMKEMCEVFLLCMCERTLGSNSESVNDNTVMRLLESIHEYNQTIGESISCS